MRWSQARPILRPRTLRCSNDCAMRQRNASSKLSDSARRRARRCWTNSTRRATFKAALLGRSPKDRAGYEHGRRLVAGGCSPTSYGRVLNKARHPENPSKQGEIAAAELSTERRKIVDLPRLLSLTGRTRAPIHRAHAARGQRLAGGVSSLA